MLTPPMTTRAVNAMLMKRLTACSTSNLVGASSGTNGSNIGIAPGGMSASCFSGAIGDGVGGDDRKRSLNDRNRTGGGDGDGDGRNCGEGEGGGSMLGGGGRGCRQPCLATSKASTSGCLAASAPAASMPCDVPVDQKLFAVSDSVQPESTASKASGEAR